MRITHWYLFLAGILLPCFLGAQAQEARISVRFQNTPLEEALQTIADRAGISFSYSPQAIGADRLVTMKSNRTHLPDLLDQLLTPMGIGYEYLEQQYVLRPMTSDELARPQTSVQPAVIYTISGFIREKQGGEALVGANIYARGTSFGTTTNSYGFYSLTLPEGEYLVVFSFLGYREQVQEIILRGHLLISPSLDEQPLEIKGVEVRSDQIAILPIPEPGGFSLTPATLRQLPAFAGNPDLLRALQMIPGIRSYGDGSSLYYVRGGHHDQNLLLLDDAPIYNPSHLFGFFSALSPEAINDAEVYKGDFPARYGGRLSSVIDVTAREGSMKKFSLSGNAGPFASYVSVEGPVVRDKSSFILSGRLSTLNWLNYLSGEYRGFELFFFDLNGKMNLQVGPRDRLFVTLYGGMDDFSRITTASYRTYGARWDNLAGSLRWNHLFSPKLFSNTTVSFSRYRYFLVLSEENDYWKSSIGNVTLKSDFTWYLNPQNTLRAGLGITGLWTNPGNVTVASTTSESVIPEVPRYQSLSYTLYTSNDQKIFRNLKLNYGIRLTLWQDLGPTTLYAFDVNYRVIDTAAIAALSSYKAFLAPEPRITAIYEASKRTSLHAGYSRTVQFIQSLSNSTGPFTSLEVWIPSGPNILPQKADQYTLGVTQRFPKPGLIFSAEAFYKYFYNHIDYRDHASMLYNPLIEGEIRQGSAESYGLELLLRRNSGQLTGWIGYTWSRSRISTPEVNGGASYPGSFDSPHNICINLAYDTYRHWSFSATWVYLTGNPVTTPTGFYYQNGYTVPVYSTRNNDRLPDYHRLDLSFAYRFNKPGNRFRHQLMFTLINAYGRLNPFSVNFNRTESSDGELVIPSNMYFNNELIPTTLSVAGIVPSINYLFRF